MVLLTAVAIEDFREQAVHFWLFPLLMVLALYLDGSHFEWQHVIINFSILFVQLAILTTYFSLKHMQFINITQAHLGWGDILFWLVLCCLFSPLNFVVFYMLSLFLSILGSWIISARHVEKNRIPLAGMQAFQLVCCLVFFYWSDLSFRNDEYILKCLLV